MGTSFHPGWEAGLELQLSRRHAVTRLTHARHWGPLRVQRPFYPGENGECHLYLLHPPGGMVTGDSLEMDIRLDSNASALLTTPSAGKIYRGNGTADSQRQQVSIKIEGNSCLEWMPLETIVFDGARGELSLRVELDDSSACALWDIVCLGRLASQESFSHGYLHQRLGIYRDGVPLYLESNRYQGGSEMLSGSWGLAGWSTAGSFLATGRLVAEDINSLRELLTAQCPQREMVALSYMDDLLAVRYLGDSAERCRHYFLAVWRYVKPRMMKREFVEPRIWNT